MSSRPRRPGRPSRAGRRGAPEFRLRVGLVVIAMVASVFGVRLVQLQGLDPHAYAARAAAEGTLTVSLPAARGEILDRNGEPLADSVDGLMVVADPALTAPDAPAIATFLSQRLGVDYISTLARLRARGSRFQYVARRVPSTLALDVVAGAKAKHFDGLSTRRDPVRTYPAGDVAANIVGFVGTDQAFGGLEQVFNKELSGRDGSERYEVAADDTTRIPLGHSVTVPAVNGTDLHTTVDRGLQWYVQRVLSQQLAAVRGDSATAVVMDSRTGEILALADAPTFDANDPAASPSVDRGARSVNLSYEPGSVEKVLTMSSLIDAGKVTDRTRLVVPGTLQSEDHTIHDWFPHDRIHLTLAGVLAKSSNIGTVLAERHFRPGQLRGYLDRFGLGQRTDVGLAPESRGVLADPSLWTRGLEDRIAFGQSVSVNAVQMTAAINTIANGGVRVSPSLIEGSATRDDGVRVGTDTATTRRVVSERAARQTTLMMERVVDPVDGVAPLAQVPGYLVAGKTGTAQRVGDTCQCYDGTETVSFAGFAPANNPRFTIYVMIQNPRNGGGGGSDAGPVFSKLMAYALHRYGVPPGDAHDPRLPVTW